MSGFLFKEKLVTKDPNDGHIICFIVLGDPEEDIFELGDQVIIVEQGVAQIYPAANPDDIRPFPPFSPLDLLHIVETDKKLEEIWHNPDFWRDRLKKDFPHLISRPIYLSLFRQRDVYLSLAQFGSYPKMDDYLIGSLIVYNHLDVLENLIRAGYKFPNMEYTTQALSDSNNLKIHKLFKEQGIFFLGYSIHVIKDHREVILWALEEKLPIQLSVESYEICLRNGNLELLELLWMNGYRLRAGHLIWPIENGVKVTSLKWAAQKGVNLSVKQIERILRDPRISLEILIWLRDQVSK